MAPIRGPPSDSDTQQRDDLGARRSLNLDPPFDVMPDHENQNQALIGYARPTNPSRLHRRNDAAARPRDGENAWRQLAGRLGARQASKQAASSTQNRTLVGSAACLRES